MAQYLEKIDSRTWRIKVLVQPRSRTNEVTGLHSGRIKIRIQAPPVNSKANKSLCVFLADILGIRKNQLVIESGLTSREKCLVVSGVDEQIWKRFAKKYNNFK